MNSPSALKTLKQYMNYLNQISIICITILPGGLAELWHAALTGSVCWALNIKKADRGSTSFSSVLFRTKEDPLWSPLIFRHEEVACSGTSSLWTSIQLSLQASRAEAITETPSLAVAAGLSGVKVSGVAPFLLTVCVCCKEFCCASVTVSLGWSLSSGLTSGWNARALLLFRWAVLFTGCIWIGLSVMKQRHDMQGI